ncbi:hypothetical protein KI655_13215 [Vibrio sp. D404a]|uniref:hypothetical protein n=1 Tax=unclassified Vibrio TaxID=2614977 RepID=UPI00255317DB|nr:MULTISPECIES: hypothetical protein [unclassified Vibrio]MDK9738259.1 hypothetical protein [Vibrio sp. D404a]MDK9796550.1 hypothetical protein [Vibrio sp. D449a]
MTKISNTTEEAVEDFIEDSYELDVSAIGDIEIDVPPMEVQLAVVDLIENHGYSIEEAMKLTKSQ